MGNIAKVQQLTIQIPDHMLEKIYARATERGQSAESYVRSLITDDIDPNGEEISQFVKEVLERDGEWLERWERA